MRTLGCLLSLLVAAVVLIFIYRTMSHEELAARPPAQHIDTVAVQTHLLSIARAERIYVITHDSYGTVDELVESKALPDLGLEGTGYEYEVEVDGSSHFRVTARPTDPEKTSWPSFSIDETMQVRTYEAN